MNIYVFKIRFTHLFVEFLKELEEFSEFLNSYLELISLQPEIKFLNLVTSNFF